MKHVKKIRELTLPSAVEMERDIAKQIFSTLQRLKEENISAFKRAVELSETKDLTVEQKVELYKLVMFYDRATFPEKEIIERSVAGLRWNEGGQMNRLNSAIHENKDNPMGYLLTTLCFIEHWSADGIVAAFFIRMIQKHVPRFVKDEEIAVLSDR